jgi:hypothetical protein
MRLAGRLALIVGANAVRSSGWIATVRSRAAVLRDPEAERQATRKSASFIARQIACLSHLKTSLPTVSRQWFAVTETRTVLGRMDKP